MHENGERIIRSSLYERNTKTIYYFFAWKICLEWNDKIPSLKRYFSGEQNSNKKLNTFVWL